MQVIMEKERIEYISPDMEEVAVVSTDIIQATTVEDPGENGQEGWG